MISCFPSLYPSPSLNSKLFKQITEWGYLIIEKKMIKQTKFISQKIKSGVNHHMPIALPNDVLAVRGELCTLTTQVLSCS